MSLRSCSKSAGEQGSRDKKLVPYMENLWCFICGLDTGSLESRTLKIVVRSALSADLVSSKFTFDRDIFVLQSRIQTISR